MKNQKRFTVVVLPVAFSACAFFFGLAPARAQIKPPQVEIWDSRTDLKELRNGFYTSLTRSLEPGKTQFHSEVALSDDVTQIRIWNSGTAVLVDPLVIGGKLTLYSGSELRFNLATLPVRSKFWSEIKYSDVPQSLGIHEAVKEFSERQRAWVDKIPDEQVLQLNKQATEFVLKLQPLSVEERAEQLRAYAAKYDPEIGEIWAAYYDPEKVREFTNREAIEYENAFPLSMQDDFAPLARQLSDDPNRYAKYFFDLSSKTIPTHYPGHSLNLLASKLYKQTPKSEFETTAQYSKRLMAASGLLGNVSDNSCFAVVEDLDPKSLHYDADKGVMIVPPFFLEYSQPSGAGDGQKKNALSWANALNFDHTDSYGDNGLWITHDVNYPGVYFRVSASVAQKIKSKSSLKGLLLFKIAGHVERQDRYSFVIPANLLEVRLFDADTGVTFIQKKP